MSDIGVTESVIEQAALAWLESLAWRIAHGPDIAPDTPNAERTDYGQVVLEQRLRTMPLPGSTRIFPPKHSTMPFAG